MLPNLWFTSTQYYFPLLTFHSLHVCPSPLTEDKVLFSPFTYLAYRYDWDIQNVPQKAHSAEDLVADGFWGSDWLLRALMSKVDQSLDEITVQWYYWTVMETQDMVPN